MSGLCHACWQKHPDRPFVYADNLTERLLNVPAWFPGFIAHVAAVYGPSRATTVIAQLGSLLADGADTHPQVLLERARRPGRSIGPLARALEDYYVHEGLALPTDHADRLAAGRRQRRLEAVPDLLRPAAQGFADFLVTAQDRARRARTRPRADSTIQHTISCVRDLALVLAEHGRNDWALVTAGDVEAFLATQGGSRARTLTSLHQFFAWARTRKLILIDPTRDVTAARPRGFTSTTVPTHRQQELFRRWTTGHVHPHEALVGMLALLHAASAQEIRLLAMDHIDTTTHSVTLGRRPYPTPLDPPTWAALERCLDYRNRLPTRNPHVLVTRGTRTGRGPASSAYLSHVLDPAGTSPHKLRVTRLAHLVNTLDPKIVAAAFGLKPEGVLSYLADHVDTTRLPPPANP